MRLLAIDPGKNAIGLSAWSEGHLERVEFVPFVGLLELTRELAVWCPSHIVCEIPQIYRTSLQKGDQGDLIEVALVAGACLTCAPVAVSVRPGIWKGQVPKTIHNKRVLAKVAPGMLAELMKIPMTKRHNVIDAVGIGQWYFDRKQT